MRRIVTPIIWLVLLTSSIVRADLPKLDPLARPDTRIGGHFHVALSVSVMDIDEKELCRTFILDGDGKLPLTIGAKPIQGVDLLGATTEEARKRVLQAIRKYYRVEPVVRVGIVRMPRIRVEVFGATFWTGPLFPLVGSRLGDALTEARYFPDADLSRVKIERSDKEGSRVRVIANFKKALDEGRIDDAVDNPILENGDVITLEKRPPAVQPQFVGVHGEVFQPGFYPYTKGMKIQDALKAGKELLSTADPESVTLIRGKLGQFFKVNAQRAMEGIETDNLDLRPDDVVIVGRKDRALRYAVGGEVAAPFTRDFKGEVTLKQAIVEAGGFRPNADRRQVILSRNWIQDPAHPSSIVLDYDQIASGRTPDIKLQAGDVVTVMGKKKQTSPLVQIGLFLLRRFLPF